MAFKVGLALGGGAARGLAHFGVIKALVEADIPIDIISGTSVGAIVGSIYAANPNITDAIRKVKAYLQSPDFDKTRLDLIRESSLEPKSYFGLLKKYVKTGLFFATSLSRSSFISEKTFRENLERILPHGNIEECPIKLGLVSMNLNSANEEVFTRGNIVQKAMASSAIPGIFPPIVARGESYVDGSWVNPVPVSVVKSLGAKFIIAVDVSPRIEHDEKELSGFEISLKASEGSRVALKKYGINEADVSLSIDLMNVHWADFLKIDHCVREGEKTIISLIEEIKKKLFWKRLRSRLPLGGS